MIRFSKMLLGILFILGFTTFLLLTSTKLFLLNRNYIINRLRSQGVYESLERGVKTLFSDTLKNQLSQKGEYSSLSSAERKILNDQIEEFLRPITKENIADFTEKNIASFIHYMNGNNQTINFYLPLSRWGIPNEAIEQYAPKEITGEYFDLIQMIKNHPEYNINPASLEGLNNLGRNLTITIFINTVFLLLIIGIYSLISPKNSRLNAIGTMLSVTGFFVMIFCWLSFTILTQFSQQLEIKRGAIEIIAGTLVPVIFRVIIVYWFGITFVLITTGVYLFNKYKSATKIQPQDTLVSASKKG